ncbi:MAG: hypothetical protein KGR26_05825 [Cyanobacteria bacterium REEB65]|nr:hypothetical protein [Cyanobacteria bacterium REEB65]
MNLVSRQKADPVKRPPLTLLTLWVANRGRLPASALFYRESQIPICRRRRARARSG